MELPSSARRRTPDGSLLVLAAAGSAKFRLLILADGKPLMSSRMHGFRGGLLAAFANLARARRRSPSPRSSSAASAWASRCARRWISCRLTPRSSSPSSCPPSWSGIAARWDRSRIIRSTIAACASRSATSRRCSPRVRASSTRSCSTWDNGPAAFTSAGNAKLYDVGGGLAAARGALKDEGVLAVWSAWEDRKFEQRLRLCARFSVRVERVRALARKKGGPRHAASSSPI